VHLLLAVLIGVVVAVLGVWAQNESLVGVNYDDGIYALLAKALAHGEGYRVVFLPVDVPGVKYPPLYPMSLVPFWLLSGSQEAALYAMKLVGGCSSAPGFCSGLHDVGGQRPAVGAALSRSPFPRPLADRPHVRETDVR
jgi:hypothetical protein